MATAYEATFNYIDFKQTMGVADVDEAAYGTIIRAVVMYIKNFYDIDITDEYVVQPDLKYAIYRHAKYWYEQQNLKTDTVSTVAEGGGNRASFDPKLPDDITYVYKFYSPNASVVLVGE